MSAWKDFSTAALLGTVKGAPPALPPPLQAVAAETAALGQESRFLTQAGALALWRRAGWQPPTNDAEPTPCEAETTAPLGSASVSHLRAMLAGRHELVLHEWLLKVGETGRHLPPEYLPALFDRARKDRALRSQLMDAGGKRAHWLANQNSDWAFAPLDESTWETGSRDQRKSYLTSLRADDPGEARSKIESVWQTEPAETRAAFLASIHHKLSDADIPFLEKTLDDRSKEVRRVAYDLLAHLPMSPFATRMAARAQSLFSIKRGGFLSKPSLEVTLPLEPDATASRDGLDPKAFGSQKVLGEKAVQLVLIVAAVPLRYWTDTLSATPADLIKMAERNDFSRALSTGWQWAARRQENAEWAAALLDSPIEPYNEFLPTGSLLSALPEPVRAQRLSKLIQGGAMREAGSDKWRRCLFEVAMLAEQAPASLVRETLAALRANAQAGLSRHLLFEVEIFFLRLPPALLAEGATGWPAGQEEADYLVDLLLFRHAALTALSQP